MRLTGHIAFITGAANGIGRVTAMRMAEEGARVVLADVDKDALGPVAAEIGDSAVAAPGDIFVAEGRQKAVHIALDAFGAPDVLVNCVGGSTRLPRANMALDEMTEDQWDSMIDFNLKGAFLCCRDLIPLMKKNGKGSIVNLTSFTGRGVTREASVAYATAKSGLVGFTRRLAVELAPFGIRCNAVAPGFVMTDRIRHQLWEPAGAAGRKAFREQIPMGRFGEAHEIASVVSFLASDEANYMTGATVDCNGGIL